MCGRRGTATRVRGSRSEAHVGGREIDSGTRAYGLAGGPWEVTVASYPHCGFSSFPSKILAFAFVR